jgi:hypothetical protein
MVYIEQDTNPCAIRPYRAFGLSTQKHTLITVVRVPIGDY